MSRLFGLTLVATLLVSGPAAGVAWAQAARASQVKVTVLSTMLVGNANSGVGEWGFAAVLEVDGRRLLVDTGARAETVLNNATELKVDLASITDLVITHNHGDHTGGLLVLRRELARRNPQALSRVHVPKGAFYPRPGANGREGNGLLPLKAQYEATGGVVAAIGGFHLFGATDETLAWTAGKMKAFGVQHLLGAHCTGIDAVFRLRQLVGLTRATAVVAGVGATYIHGAGLDATVLAR